MSETQPLQGLGQLSPFFEQIKKYDEPKDKLSDNEMLGKSSNRVIDEKWNIKIQTSVDFFTETFNFIKEMGFNTVIGLTSRQIRLYKISADNTHLTYIIIDKTEVSEYINTDNVLNADITQTKSEEPETELLIYVDFDIIDEILLDSKYPLDIYFDTKERNTMYLVNGKTKESRRLNDVSNNDPSISSYKIYYEKMLQFIKKENVVDVTVGYPALNRVLSILEKKKTKKDKSSSGILKVRFGTSEIDFMIGNEIKSSSIQMYGDDIAVRGIREATIIVQLDFLVKFKRLKLSNNVILHVNEGLPFVLETRFGAGKIRLYYLIAPREQQE